MQMISLCMQQDGCRHQTLLQCFGDSLPNRRCGTNCDLCCARKHPLLPARPGLQEGENRVKDARGAAAAGPPKRWFGGGTGGGAKRRRGAGRGGAGAKKGKRVKKKG
jgi:RecQ zinc-binding